MLNEKLKSATRIYIYEARVFVFHPDGLPGLTQPHTVRHAHTHIHTHPLKCSGKKGKRRRKKTWIPPLVCVLEQVNSLYSRIAITSTLQQGCSWLELNAAWLNKTRGLFFPPFLLKCRYDQLLSAKTTTKNFLQLPVHFSNFSFFFFTENSPTNLTITAKYAVNMLNNILVVVVFDTFQIYFL